MSKTVKRLGILGSGSGTNFQAILDAIADGHLDAEVAVVMSDQRGAGIFERAAKAGVETFFIDCGAYKSKFPSSVQREVALRLRRAGCDLVCLAGFMRLVGQPLLDEFGGRILNIHPSLLPQYPGLEAWRQALEDGAETSGCTVHWVDAGMDTGPVVATAEVPVLAGDTAESLHQRIQVAEHRLYPEAIQRVLHELPV